MSWGHNLILDPGQTGRSSIAGKSMRSQAYVTLWSAWEAKAFVNLQVNGRINGSNIFQNIAPF